MGEDSYNDRLSYGRASAVADTLATIGMPRVNIDVRGLGKLNPVADNRTAKGRAENQPGCHDRYRALMPEIPHSAG